MKKQSRKERRKSEQQSKTAGQLKKGTTVLSSALVVSSITGPAVLHPQIANATETDTQSAEVTPAIDTLTTTETTLPTEDTTTTTTEIPAETEETGSSETMPEQTTDTDPVEAPEVAAEETPSLTDKVLAEPAISAFSIEGRSAVSNSAFIAQIAGHAQSVASANDLYASVMMAQAIIESGWGGSTLSQAPNYNLFGIKGSYQGQSVYMDTWEYLNGQWVVKNEPFRKYPSFAESFYDNAYVLRNTSFQAGVYFYSGAWKSNTNSYQDATAWLTGRYATDPSYGTKLNNLIQTYNLTQYDTPSSGGGNSSGGTGGGNNGGSTSTEDTYHTVKSGDSLWALSSQYGVSIANIKSWNGLSSDVIYVGQRLIVKKGSGSSGGNTGGNTGGGSTGNNNNGGGTSTSDTYHTVKSGDSLWALSSQYGVSIANIKSWNGLSSDVIYVGQRLIVKKGNGSSGGSTGGNSGGSTGNNNNNNGGGTSTNDTYYTVKSGDSLWAISSANGVSIANLRSWNNISGDIIYPGQRLIVKKGSGSSGGSTGGNTGGGSTGNNNNNNGGSTSTSNTYYTVKSGDSLWAISSANGVSIANLRSWNNISGDIIYPGQRLIVKKGSGSSGGSTGGNSGSSSSNGKSHQVKSGDTLWGLANQYNTSIQRIKQLNGLTGDVIYIGQQLKVA